MLLVSQRSSITVGVSDGLRHRPVSPSSDLGQWKTAICKRMLDVVLGAILLLCVLPIILLGGGLLKLCSPGPILFRHNRVGAAGRPIWVWKLRTMGLSAEQELEAHLSTDPNSRHEWDTHCKLRHDPRIIPGVGSLLRRWSIDELPQLWNVIRGDMSLVGPRPLPAYHLRRYAPAFCSLRQQVRPGLTGLSQIRVRGGRLTEQQQYDEAYLRDRSLRADLAILAQTIAVILKGQGT